jgi:uncharacterized protein (TIGR03790 family)
MATTFNSRRAAIRTAARLVLASFVGSAAGLAAADTARDRVVILANADDPDSVSIARHYAEVRRVPAANIIALPMPDSETITWRQFVDLVWQPLESRLVAAGWIEAIPMDLFDPAGRRKYAVSGNRIAALVVCRGVPLRVSEDRSLLDVDVHYTGAAAVHTNQGAVDSELSLLAQTAFPVNSFSPNPLFGVEHPTPDVEAQVVKVSRLDGPTSAEALGLVDLAVEAEREGLSGRAYVDSSRAAGEGDAWLRATAAEIRVLGFDLSETRGSDTLPVTGRFDAPALYFGWYTEDIRGPFMLPGFRFPPGAVALHIHSYTARSLRSDTKGWCGPLVARGVTATVGNVYEPYLQLVHRPDLLLAALARGDDLVDAAYFALPALAWQSIVIGDPLYRPLAGAGASRGTDGAEGADSPYAVIRRMNLLDRDGRAADAIAEGRRRLDAGPDLPLALALGGRLRAAGQGDEAARLVLFSAERSGLSEGQWGAIGEAAAFLRACGRAGDAVAAYRRLLACDRIPPAARSGWLAQARAAALEAGDADQAARWQREIDQAAENALGG